MADNHYITRYYQQLGDYSLPGKVLIIYGARQVGKTTLIRHYLKSSHYKYKFDSGDDLTIRTTLASADFKTIKEYAAGYELIIIDEAQKIPNIGRCLKIMMDDRLDIRV